MTPKKPTEKAYLGTFATSLFIQGCTVLQGVLLARLLGPAGRGEFAAVILWPNVFAGLGIVGVDMAIARFAGQGKSADGLVKTAVGAALVTGIATSLVCGFFMPYLLPDSIHTLLPIAYLYLLFIPLNHIVLNLQGLDQGAGNFVWLNFSRAIFYPVYFGGLLVCWLFLQNKVFWAVVSLLLANISVVILRLFAKWNSLRKDRSCIGMKPLVKASSPFVVASIITIFYMQMDKALLVWLLAPEEIGWYVAAFAAAGSVNVLNSALGIVQFTNSAQIQPGNGFVSLAKVLRRGLLLSLLGGGVLAVLLPWLLPFVYGADFVPATNIAYLLIPGLILAGLGGIINQALRGQGQPIAGVVSKLVGLVAMATVGFVLAGIWGAKGIACGYLAGEAIAFGGLLIVAVRYFKDARLSALLPSVSDVLFLWSEMMRIIRVTPL